MKKIISAILIAALLALSLVSCGDGGVDVPDGMQIVMNSAEDGYVFFGPEGWKIANQGDVAATYLSTMNRTSITFTRIDFTLPDPSSAMGDEDVYKTAFDNYMLESSESFPYEISGDLSGRKANFGSTNGPADRAYRYIYTYKVGEELIGCLQVLVVRGNDVFVFTYTSFGSPDDENST